jgi:hypothetical protein
MFPITKEAVQTIFNGALGAMTFGACHQFQTNKIIELNNQNQEQKVAKMMEDNKKEIQSMMDKRRWL